MKKLSPRYAAAIATLSALLMSGFANKSVW